MAEGPFDKDELSLSIQILGCRDLKIAGSKSSDPYVKVLLGEKEMHKTKHVSKDLNPVFGPEKENDFKATMKYGDLKAVGGLSFLVKDFNRLGSNDTIGMITVTAPKLVELAGIGREAELPLQLPPEEDADDKKAGSITLLVQHANDATNKYWKPTPTTPMSSQSLQSGEFDTPPSVSKEILIEILSCKSLLPSDKGGTSDPYVKIKIGGKEVHKTSHIVKTLNPVFSASHKNAYIIKCPAKELYAKKGIELFVKDHDNGFSAFGFSNDDLGSVKISAPTLYKSASATDEVMELDLEPPAKTKADPSKGAGSISILIREATLGDKDIIKQEGSLLNKLNFTKSPRHTPEARKGVSGLRFVDRDEKILLVEIISCRNLLAADKNGFSDPYVKAKMGKKDLHKTDYVAKTLNPVYGEKENNKFVLDCSISELFGANGIYVKVKDWDRGVGGNDDLGSVQISAEALYECKEQEFHLDPPPGKNEDAGYVTIRTTEIDEGQRDKLKRGILPFGTPNLNGLLGQNKSVARSGPSDLSLLFEIVSCQDLRNGVGMDLSADPFVQVIMDKEMVHETEVISNNRNPIYTIKEKSVFILDVMKEEFLGNPDGICFKVIDWDPIKNDELGQVTVKTEDLLKSNGERMKLKLLPPGKSSRHNPAAMLGSAVGAVGKAGVGAVGSVGKAGVGAVGSVGRGVGKVGGNAIGVVGKGVGKVGESSIGKGVGGAISGIGKGVGKVTKPVSSVAKSGSGALVSGVKASGNAVVSAGKGGMSSVSKLNPLAHKRADDDYGEIYIRCRPATSYDRKFLKFAADQKGDFLGCRQNTEYIFDTKGGATRIIPGTKYSLKEKTGPDAGVEKYLVRPEPDPERKAVTKYLSESEIEAEALKPSREWLSLSSGKNGRLFVEMIGADDLPNTDTFGKTDPFAIVIYEDSYGKTDIIDDCLSPRWMPWSRRAFVFNIDHASSDLRVGIFDYDSTWNHDMIGRVAISVSQLRPSTEYVLSYNLYEDSVSPEREAKGTVTLRLRVELDNPKALVMSNIKPPTDQFINFQGAKQLAMAKKVVEGKTDMVSYGIGTLTMHIAELTSYKFITYYLADAVISLLLWRGQVPFFGGKFWVPVHSMIAFYAAVTFVENPTLGFAYFWFGNAWLLLAIQSWRNTTPLAWNRIMPFGRILMMMILNKAASPETVPVNFREEEAVEFENHMQERIRKAEEAAMRRYEENQRMMAEHEAETADLDQVGETDISTKKSNLADLASPFKAILYPIQQLLYSICLYLRIARNIYLWDEPYYAAFLTAGSLVIGIVFYLLPWPFLLRWTGRIIAWTVFGPHMKLVDIFYYSKLKEATDEEEAAKLKAYYESLKETAKKNAVLARIRTEEAVKQKSVKEILFGRFVERVPVIKCERFIDMPLHRSSSKPYQAPSGAAPTIQFIGGQSLVGTMIPELKSIKNEKDAEKAKKELEETKNKPEEKKESEAKVKRV